MIDPKSLRIGNLVLYNNNIIHVESLEFTRGDYFINNCWENPEDKANGVFKPIEIYEEWLEKLGFKDNINGDYWIFNGVHLFKKHSEGLVLAGWNNPIKYIHQLQNLYYSLTGQELEIK